MQSILFANEETFDVVCQDAEPRLYISGPDGVTSSLILRGEDVVFGSYSSARLYPNP